MKLDELRKELLKDEDLKQEYYKYDLAFEIADQLLEARIISGITQQKLATLVGTKQSSIARAESGKKLPSLSFLEKIATALKTKLIVKFEIVEQFEVERKSIAETQSSSFFWQAQQPSETNWLDFSLIEFNQRNFSGRSLVC